MAVSEHINRSAQDGYIFYDRLKENDSNNAWLNSIDQSFTSAIHFIDQLKNENQIADTVELLRNLAKSERKKELDTLITYYGIKLDENYFDTNRNIVQLMNEAMNIKSYWKYIRKKIADLSTDTSNYKGLDRKKHTLSGRFAYVANAKFTEALVGDFSGKPGLIIKAVNTIMEKPQIYILDDGSLDEEKIELVLQKYLERHLPNLINQIISDTWRNLNYGLKESTNDYKAWKSIQNELLKNQQFQQQFEQKYKAHFLTNGIEKKISNLILNLMETSHGNARNLFKTSRSKNNSDKTISLRSKKASEIKNIGKNFVKGITFKQKASPLGHLMELIASSLNNINFSNTATSQSITTGTKSNVFSVDIITTLSVEGTLPDLTETFQLAADEALDSTDFQWDKSGAAKVIQELQSYVERTNQDATIIYESTKEYDLGYFFKTHGGFGGTSMSYDSAAATLAHFTGKDISRYKLYFNYLLNMMEGAIYANKDVEEEKNRMTAAFAKYVAGFLFDDYYSAISNNVFENKNNAIHVFRLSGIVVPLSVFLNGMATAFENMAESQNWFRIDYTIPEKILYDNDEAKNTESSESRWNTQRKEAHKEFELSTTFFGDFIAEVKKWV